MKIRAEDRVLSAETRGVREAAGLNPSLSPQSSVLSTGIS
jgi:hypothetical protein